MVRIQPQAPELYFYSTQPETGGNRETERKEGRKKGREAGRPPELNTLKQTGDLNPDGLGTVFLLLTIGLSCLPQS